MYIFYMHDSSKCMSMTWKSDLMVYMIAYYINCLIIFLLISAHIDLFIRVHCKGIS